MTDLRSRGRREEAARPAGLPGSAGPEGRRRGASAVRAGSICLETGSGLRAISTMRSPGDCGKALAGMQGPLEDTGKARKGGALPGRRIWTPPGTVSPDPGGPHWALPAATCQSGEAGGQQAPPIYDPAS